MELVGILTHIVVAINKIELTKKFTVSKDTAQPGGVVAAY